MLPGLVSNFWAQVICLPQHPKVLRLQVQAIMPGQSGQFLLIYLFVEMGVSLRLPRLVLKFWSQAILLP